MQETIKPKFNNGAGICFTCDDKYVKILSVLLKSMVKNSSDNNTYDIIILHTDISDKSYEILKKICNKENFSIRLFNISEYMDSYNINHSSYLSVNFHISVFYRLFIPDIFKDFDRIIYLDADMIIQDDIAKLYNIDFENNYLLAAKDLDIQMWIIRDVDDWKDYANNFLKLKNPLNYIQAGMLVFNIKKCYENSITQKCINKLKELKTPRFNDQDVLNCVLDGKIKFLSVNWDFLAFHYTTKILSNIVSDKYDYASKDIKIIHYGGPKPWKSVFTRKSFFFWKYAIQTPVFKNIVFNTISAHFHDIKLLMRICWG